MRGLPLVVTAVLVALAGSGGATSIRRLTVMSASCSGASGPFPNPKSCRSFLQCEPAGVATVIPCPADLEFNAKLRVCDYAYRAGCSSSPPPPSGDDSGSGGGSDGSDVPPPPSGDDTGSGGGSGGSDVPPPPPSDVRCPPWNPADVTQLPNPKDCGSFYKCDENGVAWLISCPAGLEYNAKLRVCDYPENAGCSSSAPASDDASSDSSSDSSSDENSDSGSDESPQEPSGAAPSCPPWNPADVTQLPNPSDCNSFYKCDQNGVAWLIPCPAGLQYNADLRVCDYAASAGCSA